jgi:hypothetical protein
MLFGKHINKYYFKYIIGFILGIIALIVVDEFQLRIPEIIGDIIDSLKEQTLTKVELADDGSSVTVTIKNTLFGSSSTYTMKQVKRPIEILDEDPDSDMNWGSLS